jgi:hypothetical protein
LPPFPVLSQLSEATASAMAWATMRRLSKVKLSAMTARQPSVPK